MLAYVNTAIINLQKSTLILTATAILFPIIVVPPNTARVHCYLHVACTRTLTRRADELFVKSVGHQWLGKAPAERESKYVRGAGIGETEIAAVTVLWGCVHSHDECGSCRGVEG